MGRRGIRVRITALATVVVLAVLVVTAVALVGSQRRLLTSNLDEALLDHSQALAAGLADGGTLEDPLPGQSDDDSIAQIVGADGRVQAATANLDNQPALDGPAEGEDQRLRSVSVLDGEPTYRLLSRRVGDVVIHTGAPLDDVDESVAALRVGLGVAIPTVALALAALVWWLVGRTLRPVEAIRREVADISGSSLHLRVPEPSSGDEIDRLARTMNAMLDRVERAAERQQRFVADAAHELRSPLTRIRTELEVDLGHPAGADLAATHRSVLEETEHLTRLVDDLLLLARSDAGASGGRPEPTAVDLDDLVLAEARRRRAAPGRDVSVETSAVSAAQVRGQADELARVIRNLIDNAARHARTAVVVTLGEDAGWARLSVADDGEGIPAEHRERVFERFARLDEARTHTEGGTGLGLAIAREIVERHRGTITVDPGHSPGARILVLLPLASTRS